MIDLPDCANDDQLARYFTGVKATIGDIVRSAISEVQSKQYTWSGGSTEAAGSSRCRGKDFVMLQKVTVLIVVLQMVHIMLNFAGADQRQDDLFANENFFSRGKSALKGLKVSLHQQHYTCFALSSLLISGSRECLHSAYTPPC